MNAGKQIYKGVIITIVMVMTCVGCSTEEDFDVQKQSGLWLKPVVEGVTETRAVGDDVAADGSLNENYLGSIDVFIGKSDNAFTFHKRYEGSLSTTEGTLQLAGSDWKDTFTEGESYEVYAVANASDATIGESTTAETLTTKTQTDEDIYAPYDATNNSKKTFLMDGKLDSWTPDKDNIVTVQLRRAAAKIVVNVKLSEEMTKQFSAGTIQWKMLDYATSASLLAEGENLALGSGDTGDKPFNVDGSIITTYSYPCKWTNSDDAPRLLVNIPLTSLTDGTVKANNWYTIPVRDVNDADTDKQLERNHIYFVEATISSQGSATELINSQDVQLRYLAIDWKDEYESTWTDDDVDVDATKTDYFLVYPTEVEMRNVSTDNSVEYYSSDEVTVTVDEVYYYDMYGKKQTIANSTVTVTRDENNTRKGKITIESPVPTNLTVRYFKFTVSSEAGSQQVTAKQYPLEYIQNLDGWYSTRTSDGWIDWASDQSSHSTRKTSQGVESYNSNSGTFSWNTNNTFFLAKVKTSTETNDAIYYYTDQRGNNGYTAKTDGSSGNTNNRMYVIQITSTSSKYTIAKPEKTTDNVVSPAFVLASQLGAVFSSYLPGNDDTTKAKNAAQHCKTYKEVSRKSDGTKETKEKEWTGWRLPTKAEVAIVAEYQYTENAPISEVLAGRYYWTYDGGYATAGKESSSNSGTFVRCVRDLTPEEVEELDAKYQ